MFAFNGFTPAVSELGTDGTAPPKCQLLLEHPVMETQISPSAAPSLCFPPPWAVEGDVGMPFGSRFGSAGFSRLINSVFEIKPLFKMHWY